MDELTMGAAPRAYRAVFFDLDGTLLSMELDEFLGTYYRCLAGFVGARGYDTEAFIPALNAGIKAMMAHDDGACANEDAFWESFFARFDAPGDALRPLVSEFYETEFGRIGEDTAPDEHMVAAVRTLSDKGYPLMLTTMPLFPRVAVEWRLRWAGIDPSLFSRLTTYENSTSTKPKIAYYAENLAACGLRGEDVLMVGNNTVEDLSIQGLGADAFLVTNHLIDPVGYDLATVKHGASADFAAWVEGLPACSSPVTGVDEGIVDGSLTREVVARDARPEAIAAQKRMAEAAQAENARIARRSQGAPDDGAKGPSYASVFEGDAEGGR